MSRKNERKARLIRGIVEGLYTIGRVAALLGISERSVMELKKRYKKQGEDAFIHGNSGKRPVNSIDENLKAHIVSLKNSFKYCDDSIFNFRKLLETREGIKISYTALWTILNDAKFLSTNKCKEDKIFKLKGSFGERLGLVVFVYDWFKSGMFCALHGLIDEATRTITGLYFCRNECIRGHTETMRQTIVNHGVPIEIYAEKAGRFHVKRMNESTSGNSLKITLSSL